MCVFASCPRFLHLTSRFSATTCFLLLSTMFLVMEVLHPSPLHLSHLSSIKNEISLPPSLSNVHLNTTFQVSCFLRFFWKIANPGCHVSEAKHNMVPWNYLGKSLWENYSLGVPGIEGPGRRVGFDLC